MNSKIMQVQTKALMEWFEAREIHPAYALEMMSTLSSALLGSFIEHDMTPEGKNEIGIETGIFAKELLKAMTESEVENNFAILMGVQSLQRELVQSLAQEVRDMEKQ